MNIDNLQNELKWFGKILQERRMAQSATVKGFAERTKRSNRETCSIQVEETESKLQPVVFLCISSKVDILKQKVVMPKEELTYA